MKRITIDIVDWSRQNSDQDILRTVRSAINYAIKYEADRKKGIHVYKDESKRIEMGIKIE